MPAELLLDTHALLWWQAGGERLSAAAAAAIAGASDLRISPATCWEVAMLVAKGRVALDRAPGEWIADLLRQPGIGVAELTPEVAAAAGTLPDFHGDPADRFLYASAMQARLALVTKDRVLTSYAAANDGPSVIW